jgi:hypothetical protein
VSKGQVGKGVILSLLAITCGLTRRVVCGHGGMAAIDGPARCCSRQVDDALNTARSAPAPTDEEESAAGPEAVAGMERALEALNEREQGGRSMVSRSIEDVMEEMIEAAYGGGDIGMDVSAHARTCIAARLIGDLNARTHALAPIETFPRFSRQVNVQRLAAPDSVGPWSPGKSRQSRGGDVCCLDGNLPGL